MTGWPSTRWCGGPYGLARNAVNALALPPHIDADDLTQAGLMGVARAAGRWQPGRSKFSTLAYVYARNAVLRQLERETRAARVIRQHADGRDPLDNLAGREPDPTAGDDPPDSPDVTAALDRLPPVLAVVVRLRYGIDGQQQPVGVIARRLGLTQYDVGRLLRRAVELLERDLSPRPS